jgi:hypothetical protein
LSTKWFTDGGIGFHTYPELTNNTADDTETAFMIGIDGEEPEEAFQSHVHEFCGSTALAGDGSEAHNHRFAGMSGEAVYVPGSHVHRLEAKTDYHGHYHELRAVSGPAIYVCRGDVAEGRNDRKHIHFAEGSTSRVEGHRHEFECGTLIEAPLMSED